MKLSDFDYFLPKDLIAQRPVKPRDHSRLLCLHLRRPATANLPAQAGAGHVNRKNEVKIEHKKFYNLIDYLEKGDVLVLNNSKVFPARLIGKKITGGKIEIFLHRHLRGPVWQCLIGGRGARSGLKVEFCQGLKCEVIKNNQNRTWEIRFSKSEEETMKIINKIGLTPLPPYIKRIKNEELRMKNDNDKEDYQTVYADEKKIGSAAAPTAGFHFTPELIGKLKNKGVQFEYITLHVGLGTFTPVKVDDIKKHKMHAEWVEIDKLVIEKIKAAKKNKKRIISVGTTSTRSIESFFKNPKSYKLTANSYTSWADIFIYPGCKFKIVDALITNFHLPKSTLLMLVSAFAGKKNIDRAYKEAIRKKYRFYSYGDAMLIF